MNTKRLLLTALIAAPMIGVMQADMGINYVFASDNEDIDKPNEPLQQPKKGRHFADWQSQTQILQKLHDFDLNSLNGTNIKAKVEGKFRELAAISLKDYTTDHDNDNKATLRIDEVVGAAEAILNTAIEAAEEDGGAPILKLIKDDPSYEAMQQAALDYVGELDDFQDAFADKIKKKISADETLSKELQAIQDASLFKESIKIEEIEVGQDDDPVATLRTTYQQIYNTTIKSEDEKAAAADALTLIKKSLTPNGFTNPIIEIEAPSPSGKSYAKYSEEVDQYIAQKLEEMKTKEYNGQDNKQILDAYIGTDYQEENAAKIKFHIDPAKTIEENAAAIREANEQYFWDLSKILQTHSNTILAKIITTQNIQAKSKSELIDELFKLKSKDVVRAGYDSISLNDKLALVKTTLEGAAKATVKTKSRYDSLKATIAAASENLNATNTSTSNESKQQPLPDQTNKPLTVKGPQDLQLEKELAKIQPGRTVTNKAWAQYISNHSDLKKQFRIDTKAGTVTRIQESH